tara:strand:- start:2120 stop:3490 length:1371 start_codon:yes stop_codon:yes gene_type:complete
MGYQEGGDVENKNEAGLPSIKTSGFDENVKKYTDRFTPFVGQQQPVTGFELASMLGAGLLGQQAEKFPSIGRGLGMGFQSLSAEIKKRKEEKQKERQAVGMKAIEMASQDEQSAQKFLNDYSLKLIDLANKEIKTKRFDTSMLVDAQDSEGNPLINPQTGVGYTSEVTVKGNDNAFISELLKLGAMEKDTGGIRINQGVQNKFQENLADNITKNMNKWQEEADAAGSLRDQILIARTLGEELGEDGFGRVEDLTMGLRSIFADLPGMKNLVDATKLSKQQALQQTSIGFVMALVGKTKGAISNKEMDIFFQASPTLGSTYQGYMMMLDYMDRIANLTEKYNEEWSNKLVDLAGEPIEKINAEYNNFKKEFKANPENKLIKTAQEKEYLEGVADMDNYNAVNSKYLDIQAKARVESEKVSNVNQRASNLIKEIENDDSLSAVEKAQEIKKIQDILSP